MPGVSESPWTDEQVAALKAWQASVFVHPYTCRSRSEPGHKYWEDGGDVGALLPTTSGFVCRDCGRVQPWCYERSFEPIRNPFDAREGNP